MATPDMGGAVMATGIVSIAMLVDGQKALARGLLLLTAIGWAVLGAAFLSRLALERGRWQLDAQRPSSLSAVAGTAGLGTGLTLLGWSWAGWILLAIATSLWLTLSGILIRANALPSSGSGFLIAVAPQSVAVLAATVGDRLALGWLTLAALLPFAIGLVAYALALARFDVAHLRSGAGDHWVAGGALASSTLACAEIARAAAAAGTLGEVHKILLVAGLVLWALTIVWLAALIGAEARWRRIGYDVHRWATVFPLGMYSAMSFAVGDVARVAWIVDFGCAWGWLALGVWSAVALGATRSVITRAAHV